MLQPSLIATEFKAPLLKFAHREQGFFSCLTSNTISFIFVSSIKRGTSIFLQVSSKNSLLKNSNVNYLKNNMNNLYNILNNKNNKYNINKIEKHRKNNGKSRCSLQRQRLCICRF